MKKVIIYTDGCCKGNPGLGGYGAILSCGDTSKELFGGEAVTTNNRMELTAAIMGLEAIKKTSAASIQITIYSDSKYVIQGITEWLPGWKRKNWKDVKNRDLWERLDRVASQFDLSWSWVKGHSGNPGNERADQLANIGAKQVATQSASARHAENNGIECRL